MTGSSRKATEAELEGKRYEYLLSKKYRWEAWAAPKGKDGKLDHHTVANEIDVGVVAVGI